MIAYLDGLFVDDDKALVPISDRGFLYGDGTFATLKVVDGKIEKSKIHLDIMKKNAEELKIEIPDIQDTLLNEIITRNEAKAGIWRMKVIITGGSTSDRIISPRKGRVIITIEPYKEEIGSFSLAIFKGEIITPFSQCKTLSYIHRLLVRTQATERGFDDGIVTTREGYLLETSFANIFWIVEKQLFTPSNDLPLYFGGTLQEIIKDYESQGFKINYVKANLNAIPNGAKVFVCNTMIGHLPVNRIEDRNF